MKLFKRFLIFNNKNSNKKIDRTINQNDRHNTLFIFTLFILAITVVSCWQVIINPTTNPEVVKSAFNLNTVVVSSLIIFATGKVNQN